MKRLVLLQCGSFIRSQSGGMKHCSKKSNCTSPSHHNQQHTHECKSLYKAIITQTNSNTVPNNSKSFYKTDAIQSQKTVISLSATTKKFILCLVLLLSGHSDNISKNIYDHLISLLFTWHNIRWKDVKSRDQFSKLSVPWMRNHNTQEITLFCHVCSRFNH